jgi:molybdopterin synthase sulfur carrier subunit
MIINFFGQLTDITKLSSIKLENIADTNLLIEKLQEQFPALASAKYSIAVNNQIIQHNTTLTGNNVIALMPPFSGG